jgi:hypothetical protein
MFPEHLWQDWVAFQYVNAWWLHVVHAHPGRRKAMDFLGMFVAWKIWNKHNARVFKNKRSLSFIVFGRIKLDARSCIGFFLFNELTKIFFLS